MRKAKIIEIFSSIQGEGPYLGEEQVFLRFYDCNLSCEFCDERKKTTFKEYEVKEVVEKILKEKKKVVSLTGGEPLLQSDFLKNLLPVLKKEKLKIYLETNGILKDKLLEVLNYIDIISMDLKLPSSIGSTKSYWEEHLTFLRECVKKEVFTKSVVTPQTSLSDIKKAVSLVKTVDKNIPFIIQPVSYNGNIEKINLLEDFFNVASGELNRVRIIPQIHKILGVK